MVKNNKAIGIFDSGVGGLSIMRSIVKELPEYNFIYLGDTALFPYGTHSKDIVYKNTKQAVDFLFSKNCDLIVFACNTASSNALHKIQQEYIPKKYPNKKVLGIIVPTVEFASSKTKNKRIGVIATEATVSSKAFEKEFYKIDSEIKVFQNACPMLVPIVEANEDKSELADIFLEKYLRPLLDKKIDTLILGCTHYIILENKIRKIVGENVALILEEEIVAKKLADYLEKHSEIENNLGKDGAITIYLTDLTENSKALGDRFFGKKIDIEKVKIY